MYEAESALNGFEVLPSSKYAKNVIDQGIGIPSEDVGEVMKSVNDEFDPQRDWELLASSSPSCAHGTFLILCLICSC